MQLSAEQDVSSEGSTYAKLEKVDRIIPEKSDKIIHFLSQKLTFWKDRYFNNN